MIEMFIFSAQGFTIFAVLASIMYAGHNQLSEETNARKQRRSPSTEK